MYRISADRIISVKDVHILNSRTDKCVTFQSKRDFANGIKLRWRDYSGLSKWALNVIISIIVMIMQKEADGGLTSSREEADRMI